MSYCYVRYEQIQAHCNKLAIVISRTKLTNTALATVNTMRQKIESGRLGQGSKRTKMTKFP